MGKEYHPRIQKGYIGGADCILDSEKISSWIFTSKAHNSSLMWFISYCDSTHLLNITEMCPKKRRSYSFSDLKVTKQDPSEVDTDLLK